MKMVQQIRGIDAVISSLTEIHADATTPRNVRVKIEAVIDALKNGTGLPIKINKALSELDEVASDTNLQPYTRTQIWGAMSVLEKLIS